MGNNNNKINKVQTNAALLANSGGRWPGERKREEKGAKNSKRIILLIRNRSCYKWYKSCSDYLVRIVFIFLCTIHLLGGLTLSHTRWLIHFPFLIPFHTNNHSLHIQILFDFGTKLDRIKYFVCSEIKKKTKNF